MSPLSVSVLSFSHYFQAPATQAMRDLKIVTNCNNNYNNDVDDINNENDNGNDNDNDNNNIFGIQFTH